MKVPQPLQIDRPDIGKDNIVAPGQILTGDQQFMRGHGTFHQNESLVASVAGKVERVNKLVSVRPLKTRFNGEIGDVVVGRIIELGPKRWKVDIKGRQDAVLLLSSINLPGGIQRRKTENDELEMRSFFQEGDLLSAEVQAFFGDGSASLHTRNMNKYGKLRNGCLVIVPSALIKRSKSHFVTLSCNVDLILGLNGYIFVQKRSIVVAGMAVDTDLLYSDKNDKISAEERQVIARVCNIIRALADNKISIYDSIIEYAYQVSLDYACKDISDHEVRKAIIEKALKMT